MGSFALLSSYKTLSTHDNNVSVLRCSCSAQYFCSSLTEFGVSRQFFLKFPSVKFHENPSS